MKYYGGCDSGSTYTKCVILDETGKMVADVTLRSRINSVLSAQAALDEAVEKFVAMRTVEGENLKKDILLKGERIRTLVAEVKERSPLVVVEYQEKLNNRLKDLLGGVDVDPQRIATEVAVFADRGCVDEEVTRLESHLIQLKDILDGGGQVGRKLDFLIQEMNRESNTIASKANDIQIVKATIELKSEIEKIREQIQNLE